MKLDVQFEVEPLLLIADDSFTNKSMLSGSRLLFFGNQTPEHINEEDQEDKRLNWLCDQICEVLEHEDVPFMVVQQNLLAPSHKNSGIRLVSHIRLSKNEKLNQLPIVILTDRANDQLLPKSQQDWEELAPLYSKGVRFTPENDKERRYTKNDSLLMQEIEKLYGALTRDGKNEVNMLEFTDPEKPAIPIAKPEGSNHQLTNDWGAYRLIQAAGLTPTHQYRKHLYFSYLKRSSKEPKPADKELFKDKINLNLNILLIDDNHQKGWKNSIEEILNKCLLTEGCEATVDPLEYADSVLPLLEEKNGKREIDKYDVVYLDLRLPADKDNRNNPLSEQGIRVLNEIKRINPTIPVIMFTASTKATNMDDLYELGVDGYFVKEFPETRTDADFSKKNLEGFVKTTRSCLEKGNLLKNYWTRIQSLRKGNIIKEHVFSMSGSTHTTKLKERIPERLEMFIGILKKAFEQTEFDTKAFYYDQYETAFLTLWSCLNDIVASYYSRHNTIAQKKFKWIDRFMNNIYVDFVGNNALSPLSYDKNTMPYFTIMTDINGSQVLSQTPTWVNYQITLSNQIAFLLDSICEKYLIDASEKEKYFGIVKRANDVRNRLWLTHSELLDSNYLRNFMRTLKVDRVSGAKNKVFWEQNIADLFSLIEFLTSTK